MNAINFIQQHGVDKAREVVEGAPETATHFTEALGGHYAKEGMLKMKPQWLWFNSINKEWYYDFAAKDHIHLPDLKRLVESVYFVKEHHTLDRAIEYANSQYTAPEIKVCLLDAIADYKSIYSDKDMGDDLHIENHVSPNCKKFDERVNSNETN